MRTGLFIERFNPARGGRERSTAEIAAGLIERGCSVDIVCMSGDGSATDAAVIELGSAGLGRTHRFKRFVRAAQRHMAATGYDVTHAMFPLPGADVYQLRGGTLPGLRKAHLRMSGGFLRRLTWPLNRLRAAQARFERQVMADGRTICLPVSAMVADEIRRHYNRTENVRVVFNGAATPQVDADTRAAWRRRTREAWGLDDDDVVLLCPAMNFDLKGVGYLLTAFERICWRDDGQSLRLVVLGNEGTHARKLYKPPRITDPIGRPADATPSGLQFRPAVDDIYPAYAAADGVVLLSWYDACSRVVLEAIGCGLPCITTAFNGAATLLADGAGWVVSSPCAVDEVVDALTAIADPTRRAAAADACLTVAPQASMSRHVDELMDVYRKVAQS